MRRLFYAMLRDISVTGRKRSGEGRYGCELNYPARKLPSFSQLSGRSNEG